jgi:hypothetical protein
MLKPTLALLLAAALLGCDVANRSTHADAPGSALGARWHVVRRGDTLFSIAEQVYGNGLEWPRLHEANPWVAADPDRIEIGTRIFIPPPDPVMERSAPSRQNYALDPGSGDFEGDPAAQAGEVVDAAPRAFSTKKGLFRNILPALSRKTLFGLTLDKVSFFVLLWSLVHATLQGFILWVTTNLTFVRETSIRKSLRATFLTEIVTVCTVVVLAVVGLMMVYVGTTAPGEAAGMQLFPTVEEYLRHPAGMAVGSLAVLFLYVVLSLRFIPQVFGMQTARAFTVVFVGVLLPHLAGMYVAGQRMGLIE